MQLTMSVNSLCTSSELIHLLYCISHAAGKGLNVGL
jgi:hypothetical protein